jgi:MFS family permease
LYLSTYAGTSPLTRFDENQIVSHRLHGAAIEAFWTGTSFLLSSTVFQLPTGALSDIFGRRVVLAACIIFFLLGIIIAGVANDFITLLVGRTIQGMGGGGIILLNRIIITDLVPLRQQGAYLGITNAMWALGSVTGPVIGGALASAAFWVNS